jgi:hypothetical protein
MVHENSKDLKLEVPPDDMTLTLRGAVTRRVKWRRTSIDVDLLAAASVSNVASLLNTAPSIFLETCLSPSAIQEQSLPSPILEQLRLSPIREQPRKSLIHLQPRKSPPRTQSTPVPNQARPSIVVPKAMKNARGKSQPQ